MIHDCAIVAIATATGSTYAEIARQLPRPSRYGIARPTIARLLRRLGWRRTPLRDGRLSELPSGRLVVEVRRHLCAVIDGKVFNLPDPSARVFGYWQRDITSELERN